MSHWGVRNQSETSQKPAKRNLSLSLAYSLTLLPEILRLLLFQFPLPLLLLLVLLVLLWVFRTVSGPRKLILLPSLKQCVHAWILTLITRLATTLSTTTTPAATAPPLPLVHLGISAFAFKSNWHESRWRVRNQSETRKKPATTTTITTTTATTTPTPTPPPTTGITVSFPDRAIFFSSQIWKRTRSWADPSTSVATTLSITTSAATTATPLPLLHRGIFAFAFLHLTKLPWKGQKSVRNLSETGQARVSDSFPRSLSLSFAPPLSFVTIHYIIHNLYFMYMIWSKKNKPFRDCSLWYRGCYAIGWAIEGCPGKGILDNPHMYILYTDNLLNGINE